jgi:hypothetical protein
MTPTQDAQSEFKRAVGHILQLSGENTPVARLSPILINLFQGLDAMAVAQRATYIKLEQIETLLKRQAGRSF